MTYAKFWENEVASSMARNFSKKCLVLIEFFRSKKSLPIILSDVKTGIWTFSFTKKTSVKKNGFSKKNFFFQNILL